MTLVGAAILGQRVGRFGAHRPHWIAVIFLIGLLVLVIAGIVALITWIARTRHAARPQSSPAVPTAVAAASAAADPRRILDERLARGEIDPDDYRSRRDALES